MALAGGASIRIPQGLGYQYVEGSVESASGVCRPFDQQADGTIMSSGAGVVLLKPLREAQADGDHIYAVIKGSAVNNDGKTKVNFAAPSPEGQQKVIEAALQDAGVSGDSIGYVETHGTGTKIGDAIEIAALKEALKVTSGSQSEMQEEKVSQPCFLGAIKANVGHLDTAAGVVGLIKTALILEKQQIVPLANFVKPNEAFETDKTRFELPKEPLVCKPEQPLLRAGVSSFGIGGTNAHVVLEAASHEADSYEGNKINQSSNQATNQAKAHLLLLTGHSDEALTVLTERVVEQLEAGQLALEPLAQQLALGVKHHAYRQFVYLEHAHQAGLALDKRAHTAKASLSAKTVAVAPALIEQLPVEWLADLYREVPIVKAQIEPLLVQIEKATDSKFDLLQVAQDQASQVQASQVQASQIEEQQLAKALLALAWVKSLQKFVELDSGSIAQIHNAFDDVLKGWLKSPLKAQYKDAEPKAMQTESESNGDQLMVSVNAEGEGVINIDIHSSADAAFNQLLGQLWLCGIAIHWQALFGNSDTDSGSDFGSYSSSYYSSNYSIGRVVLPPYPYQRQSHWFGDKHGVLAVSSQPSGTNEITHRKKDRPAEMLGEFVPPSPGIEQEVAAIWQDVLGVAPVGMNDDFFALGGHSLLASKMINAVKEEFDVSLSLDVLFGLLSPAKMSEHILIEQAQGISPEMLASLIEQE